MITTKNIPSCGDYDNGEIIALAPNYFANVSIKKAATQGYPWKESDGNVSPACQYDVRHLPSSI